MGFVLQDLISQRRSPHQDDRPEGTKVSLVVIHNISLPPDEFGGPWIDDLFMGRLDASEHPYFESIASVRVSSHYLIRRDGSVVQYVPCEKRAWHAGASSWKGRERCNDFSIGIELEGSDNLAFMDAQYESLNELLRSLAFRYGKLDIAGHSDIAPGRKTDPGPAFQWDRVRPTR